jgi:5-methylcytosine-specific restriction enzyme subunit McrC
MQSGSLVLNRVVCEFDELTPDVPHNRILKAALRSLAQCADIDPQLAVDINALYKRLSGVSDLRLTRDLFRSLQLTRNSGHYGLLMRVCEMVLDSLTPEEGGIGSRFAAIADDEERMSRIFESFVLNFFRQEQLDFSVWSEGIAWDAECSDAAHAHFLPNMRTDVTLRSHQRAIVIDAKFYKETLATYRLGKPKIRSGHLYQILAYLQNMERHGGVDAEAEGVLLYPLVAGEDLSLEYTMLKHKVRVWTVDLTAPWRSIHERMLDAISERAAKQVSSTSSAFAEA